MIKFLLNAALIISVSSSSDKEGKPEPPRPSKIGKTCRQSIDQLPCNILYDVVQTDGLFSISKGTLENDCPKLIGSFQCLKDHWNRCNPNFVDNLIAYTSGMKSVIEELCDGGSALRREYENNIPCLSASSQSLMNCTLRAQRKASSQWMNSSPRYLLSATAYRCVAHLELVSCVRSVASKLCGSGAGKLLSELVERSVRPYRVLNCHFHEKLSQPSRKKEYGRLLF